MEVPLNHDLAHLQGFLPPGIEINIKLTRASNDFALVSKTESENFQLVITECVLQMHGMELNPGMLSKQHELLSDHNAYYHYTKSIIKSFTIAAGTSSWSMSQICGTVIPIDMICAFIPTLNYNGSYATNPFFMSHCNITEVNFKAEGYQPKVIRVDFDKTQLASMYKALYEPDMGQTPPAGHLKMSDMKNGLALFRIKLGHIGYERALRVRHGQTHFSFQMSEETKVSHTLICYARKHDHFSVDVFKNVYGSDQC